MKSTMFGLVGAGLIGTFAVCTLCPPPADATPSAAAAGPGVEMRTVTLHVEGMTCGGCAISTRIVLERLPGVRQAVISYEERQAVVTYDPARVNVERMIAAVKTLGYTATVLPGKQT